MTEVLGLNRRNALIRVQNPRSAIQLVRDKARTKQLLTEHGVSVPMTYKLLDSLPRKDLFETLPNSFVIKPNRGSKGMGIMVLTKGEDNIYSTPSGKQLDTDNIIMHIRRTLNGDFSGGRADDTVLIEEVVHPSSAVMFKNPIGLPDIRIIISPDVPVVAMMRYPTPQSDGRANLAKGALGIAIDVQTGELYRVFDPASRQAIPLNEIGIAEGYCLPHWNEAVSSAQKCRDITGLSITGVDFVLDEKDTWRVLEVNGHPGLEIQNITQKTLHPDYYKRIKKEQTASKFHTSRLV